MRAFGNASASLAFHPSTVPAIHGYAHFYDQAAVNAAEEGARFRGVEIYVINDYLVDQFL